MCYAVSQHEGNRGRMELKDVLVVAPYNAQVSDLLARLPKNARVGTVDKFQGQEAPVVIYSLTTSTPEDAPRGMEFLYSLNRLNVATSRAESAVIVVGNPRLVRAGLQDTATDAARERALPLSGDGHYASLQPLTDAHPRPYLPGGGFLITSSISLRQTFE